REPERRRRRRPQQRAEDRARHVLQEAVMAANQILLPPVTNREQFKQVVQLYDRDEDELIDIVDDDDEPLYDIVVEMSPANPSVSRDPRWPLDTLCNTSPVLTATLDDGVSIIDTGTIEFAFGKSQMATLAAGVYDIFMVLTSVSDADEARQIF